MGIMVYSLFWVMQDLYHQPYSLPATLGISGPFRVLQGYIQTLDPKLLNPTNSKLLFPAFDFNRYFGRVQGARDRGRVP